MTGALLNSVPKDDEASSLDFMGSTLVCIAESKEQIVDQLNKDVYAKSGVWDVEKVCSDPSLSMDHAHCMPGPDLPFQVRV